MGTQILGLIYSILIIRKECLSLKFFNENHRFVIVVLPQNHGLIEKMRKEEEKEHVSEITL